MKTAMRVSGALRHIEHFASLRLDPLVAIPEMLRTLAGVMPEVPAHLQWVGEDGVTLGACGADGAGKTAAHPAGGSADAWRLDLVSNGQVLAVLKVRGGARLGERERRLFRTAAPFLRDALQAAPTSDERFGEVPDQTGVLTITPDGRLIGADRDALLLVAEMDGRPLLGTDVSALQTGDRLPHFLTDLCARSRFKQPATLQRQSRWGAYRAQLFAPDALGEAASPRVMVIAKHLPRRVGLMRAIESLDLSPRERQAAFQLGIGADADAGAAALGVSISSWRSYVKRVYMRLDVRDRFELYARLNARA